MKPIRPPPDCNQLMRSEGGRPSPHLFQNVCSWQQSESRRAVDPRFSLEFSVGSVAGDCLAIDC